MNDIRAWLAVVAFTQGGSLRSLRYPNFLGYDLSGLDFSGCRFEGASFDRCNLSRTKFRGCDLTMASMRYANLTDADLTDANLTLTDMTASKIDRTIISSAQQLADAIYAEREWPMASFLLEAALIEQRQKHQASKSPAPSTPATLTMPPAYIRDLLRRPTHANVHDLLVGCWL